MSELFSLQSIAEGVTIGLTISFIVGFFAFTKRWWDRRNQIRYIRSLITRAYKAMRDVRDQNVPDIGAISADFSRKFVMQITLRNLNEVLDYRSTRLKPSHLYDMRAILADAETINSMRFKEDKTGKMSLYNTMYFERFAELKWLGFTMDDREKQATT